MENKIVFLDFGYFMFKAIHAFRMQQHNPNSFMAKTKPTDNAMKMMVACLKRLGLTPDDLIIVAVDKGKSWRRNIDTAYKANRKEQREKLESYEWWKERFKEFDELKILLGKATPFFVIEIDNLEADDIISYGVRYFTNNKCIIVSHDSDFEQLAYLENVRLFVPKDKLYKTVKNPHAILAKKIEKETVDNLVTPVISKEDFEKRKSIVDLSKLPDWVEQLIDDKLANLLIGKKFSMELLPLPIQNIFMDIYNSNVVVDENKRKRKRKKKGVDNK